MPGGQMCVIVQNFIQIV